MSGGPLGSNPPSPPAGPPWCTCGCGENKPMVWNQLTQNWVNPTPRQRAEMSLDLANNSFALLVEKLTEQSDEDEAAVIEAPTTRLQPSFLSLNEALSTEPKPDNTEVTFHTATTVRQPSATATAVKAKLVTITKSSSSRPAATVKVKNFSRR